MEQCQQEGGWVKEQGVREERDLQLPWGVS